MRWASVIWRKLLLKTRSAHIYHLEMLPIPSAPPVGFIMSEYAHYLFPSPSGGTGFSPQPASFGRSAERYNLRPRCMSPGRTCICPAWRQPHPWWHTVGEKTQNMRNNVIELIFNYQVIWGHKQYNLLNSCKACTMALPFGSLVASN